MMTMMTIVASVLVATVETMTTTMMMMTTGTIATMTMTMTMTTTDGVAPAQEGVDVTMMTINSNFLSQL